MTDFLRALCEQVLDIRALDPEAVAARLGRIAAPVSPGAAITVVPFDARFATALIAPGEDAGESMRITLVPAARLTLAEVTRALGTSRPSARPHPDRPHKHVFRFGPLHVVAEVSADEPAAIQKLVMTQLTSDKLAPPPDEPPAPVWPRLLGERAGFGVRSWRDATLDAVREELEGALGVRFVPSHDKVYDGAPAFECGMPACTLRLSSWPTDTPDLQLFNFIGEPSEDLELALPREDDIGEAIAAYLRDAGCDWYVPDRLEKLGSVLGARQLEPDVIVATLAPRWLAWCDAKEREVGVAILHDIAAMWLAAGSRTADPIADLKQRRADFEVWGRWVRPRARLRVLFAYAVQERLTMIEGDLFDLKELPAAERAADAAMWSERLAEWRAITEELSEAVTETGLDSVARQYERVRASIDELTATLRDAQT